MSSSKKKQLRKEHYMTERQVAAAKEAKQLKRYTMTFWVVIALVICVFATAVAINPIKTMSYKNTTAMTVGNHNLSSVDVNYFFIDAVNGYVSQYSSYISYILDVEKPLNEQYIDSENKTTWADSFMTSATSTIKSTYALYDLAVKNGHELTDAEKLSIDNQMSTCYMYALYNGFSDVDSYLRALYGYGADQDSYRKYLEVSTLANSYLSAYSESLEYTTEEMMEYYNADPNRFTSFTFSTYYVNASAYLEGGTKDDKGNTVYSDEEKAAALVKAKQAADELAGSYYSNVDGFDAAIKEMPINEKVATASATKYDAALYEEINTLFRDWLVGLESDSTLVVRQEGDMTVIPYVTGSGDSEVVNGFYVLRYESLNDNSFALKNVRHVLVAFEGGTTDSTTGATIYSDADKDKAKIEAERLLSTWIAAGDLSEESFADLAKEHSDDNASAGGLYEDVYPGQMVSVFEDWCYDAERKVGDYGIIVSDYGCHIMFFVGDSETTFRDFMIENVMRNEEVESWHNTLVELMVVTTVNTKHIPMDMVLSH